MAPMLQPQVFYLRMSSWDERLIIDGLLTPEFNFIEACGSRIVFEPIGAFDVFKGRCEQLALANNLTIVLCILVDDPGLCLMLPGEVN